LGRVTHFANEGLPDLNLGSRRQGAEVHGDMDTRQGRFRDLDSIGSQEENATIVFNVTEADVIKRF